MRHPRRICQPSQGFTLLELIIAISIFAIVSILTYQGLNSVIQASHETEKKADKLKQLQLAMVFIYRDMKQIVPRRMNDGGGQSNAALVTGSSDQIIEFTRDGNPNPAGTLRSSLQRVRYAIDEETLYRLSWNFVDHTQNAEPLKMRLLDDVLSLTFRFMDNQKQWQDSWLLEAEEGGVSEAPSAIEMNLEHKEWGNIQRIFSLF